LKKLETNRIIGLWGEQLASQYLEKKGFVILEKNWRWKRSEIDLIARDGNTIVFVEVKARKNSSYGHPEAFVTHSKAARIKRASVEYQYENNVNGFIRFDIISITGNPSYFEIVHILDAF